MNKQLWGMLSASEQELLRRVEQPALVGLDEDELADLHDRVRRARNKYSKLYRRRAGEQVRQDGARAGAHPQHARTAAKAEAFEDALARVSRHLARAAKASADELKAARLAAARATGRPTKARSGRAATRPSPGGPPAARAKRTSPASKRARAATRASTARTQARRDSR